METEVRVNHATAETVYINHVTASWGTFCYNSIGDLFINSDWGFFGYSWRHYGPEEFKQFLSQTNPDYLVGKFGINYREVAGKKMKAHTETNLKILVRCFIDHLKKELQHAAK